MLWSLPHRDTWTFFRKNAVVLLLLLSWVLSMMAGLWQYGLPDGYWPIWGVNLQGVKHFSALYRVAQEPLTPGLYAQGFKLLMASALTAYGALLLLARRQAFQVTRPLLLLSWVFVVAFAAWVPAGLSCDVYAYVAYARMALLYDMNPYVHTQFELKALGDAIAPFLQWDVPSPYGPFWTQLTILLLWPIQSAGLAAQVLLLKGLAGAALVWLAREAARLAQQMAPGTGGVTFLSITACPLLLLEGPGSGHNDLIMMALLLTGLRWWQQGHFSRGSILLGASAAIKFIPLLALPWLLWMRWRKTERSGFAQVALSALLMLLPLLLSGIPFALEAMPTGGLSAHTGHLQKMHRGDGVSQWMPLLAYLALSFWIVLKSPVFWSTAWVAVTLALLIFIGPAYPWYVVWPLGLALTRWDKVGVTLSATTLLVGHALLLGYV